MEYIKTDDLEFKYLASSPADLGLILNYIKRIKEMKEFKYKSSHRSRGDINIAYGWTANFMIGIELCKLTNNEVGEGFRKLELTEKGERIYEIIKDYPFEFPENSSNNLKSIVNNKFPELMDVLRDIVAESVPYRNLVIFFLKNKKWRYKSSELYNDFFGDIKKFYTGEDYTPNSSTATTGENRLTGLMRLCEFIGFIKHANNHFYLENTIEYEVPEEYVGNKIYYGPPGVGKSKIVNDLFYRGKEDNCIRVTFHPEYTYNDFVGFIKPVVLENTDSSESKVLYKFVPGPFTKILAKAFKYRDRMHNLIIEELNRANAPAVFGELFQLLDRKENGESQYRIYNLEIYNYIINYIGDQSILKENEIYIPSNLNIIATMNTSDQNVFVMDTAFKRRWQFEYINVEFKEDHPFKDKIVPNLEITWQEFVECINKYIMSEVFEEYNLAEDKQLGPYFIQEKDLEECSLFAYKVLLYLWDDVAKHNRQLIFDNSCRTFNDVVQIYINGKNIFSKDLKELMNNKKMTKE